MNEYPKWIDFIFPVLLTFTGGYWFFFAQRHFPSGNHVKIQRMKWLGFAIATVGVMLFCLEIF